MKCCQKTYSSSTTICSECGQLVLFAQYPITQERWESAIHSVSSGGFYHFTVSQLFSEFLEEKSNGMDLYRLTLVLFLLGQCMLPPLGMGIALLISLGLLFLPTTHYSKGVFAVFLSVVVLGVFFSVGLWGVLSIPALFCATLFLRNDPKLLLSYEDVIVIQEAWFHVFPNPQYIGQAEIGNQVFIPEETNTILLVDRDILVDFFVRNGFVAQHRCAVVSSRHIPLVARGDFQHVFFLHGSGKHIETVTKAIPVIDIGWTEAEVAKHPSFQEFIHKDQLPVDLLSPKELLDSTTYALNHRVGILQFFENST